MAAVKQDNVYVPSVTGAEIPNVPFVVANAFLEVAPLTHWTDKIWLTGAIHLNGQELAPITASFKSATGVVTDYTNLDNRLPTYTRVDIGLHITDLGITGLMVDGTISNLLNTTYYQGGSPTHPYPQPGLWAMVNLAYHLPL
jgi:hypothetical protein